MPLFSHPSINADTNVDLLIDCFPSVVPVFVKRRLHCVGCPMARFETLADVCRIYGLPIDPLLADLRASAMTGIRCSEESL